jgi:hypothetical protein
MAHISIYQVPHAHGFSDMSIRINNTQHFSPPGQVGEKGSSASLRSIASLQLAYGVWLIAYGSAV